MVIIKRCILHCYFQLYVSAPSFASIFRMNSIFLSRQCVAIYNNIVNCIHSLLKKTGFSLKMAPKEGAEICSWK